MLGRQELKLLELEKRALLAQSSLNRLTLQAELQNLGAVSSWAGEASRASRGLSPLLTFLGPVSRFLLARGRSASWIGRLIQAASLIVPVYRLWKTFAARRKETREGQDPAAA